MPVAPRAPSPDYERSPSPESDDGPGPSKRARMTEVDIQRRRLEKLLANPDKEVYIPENMGQSLRAPKDPKDVLRNVTGSSAAAGSGEFHVYKNARRREAERIRFMESQARELEEQAAFQKRQEERDAVTNAKTAKNRARRQKRKGKGDAVDKAKAEAASVPAESKLAPPEETAKPPAPTAVEITVVDDD